MRQRTPATCPTCPPTGTAPPSAAQSSSRPVRYLNGEVELSVVDIESGGFGANWNHSRTYSNQLSNDADFGQGYNQAHEVWHAQPSAVVGYDDSAPDLAIQLRPADGLIEQTTYYAGAGSGGAPGYVAARKLQRGAGGTPVVLQTYQYASHTAGGATVYPVAAETVYRNEDGTGAITTTYDHTFYPGTTQIQQRTTTLPVVPMNQNGSGVAAMRKSYFEGSGRETWSEQRKGVKLTNDEIAANVGRSWDEQSERMMAEWCFMP